MAFLGSDLTNEVGLRLLLWPLGSNIVTRGACCSVGVVLPVYSTLRAIERNNQNEQQKWLIYWADFLPCRNVKALIYANSTNITLNENPVAHDPVIIAAYGSFTLVETFSDKLLSWFPYYYHFKFAFLVWLQLPSTEGAKQIYKNHLRPNLLKHQARIDQLMGFASAGMVRFIGMHQKEFQIFRAIMTKIIGSDPNVRDGTEPAEPRELPAIDGPARPISDSESDDEEFIL